MQLLADRLVELGVVPSISDETVRRVLKKNALKPWQKKHWCISKVTADFVWRMEDILERYAEAYDPRRPVVCFDERPYQLLADARAPLAMKEGRPRREDYEYRRRGDCNLFVVFQPASGWRRTSQDFARQMKWLVDEAFPKAELIRVVLDNLNTYTPAALYQMFPAEEARPLTRKLAFHYTSEYVLRLSVLARPCLNRGLGNIERMRQEIQAWQVRRNAAQATVEWRFTTAEARSKLRRLYPQ